MRAALILMLVALIVPTARADSQRTATPQPMTPQPVVCEESQTLTSLCTEPYATWARSQPDFENSLQVCIANCRKEKPCVGR